MARFADRLRWEWAVAGGAARVLAVVLPVLLVVAVVGLVAAVPVAARADAGGAVSGAQATADDGAAAAAMTDSLVATLDEGDGVVAGSAPVRTVLRELVLGTDVAWVRTLPCSTDTGYMLPERGHVVWCVGEATGRVFVSDAGSMAAWESLSTDERRTWLGVAYAIRAGVDLGPVEESEGTVVSSTATVHDVLTEFVVGPDVWWVTAPCSDGRGDLLPDAGPAGCVNPAGQPFMADDGADALWVDLTPAERSDWLTAGIDLRDLVIAYVDGPVVTVPST